MQRDDDYIEALEKDLIEFDKLVTEYQEKLIKRHGMIQQGKMLEAGTKKSDEIKNLGFMLYMDSHLAITQTRSFGTIKRSVN